MASGCKLHQLNKIYIKQQVKLGIEIEFKNTDKHENPSAH